MAKSPAHQKWPDHRIEEQTLSEAVRVEAGGEILAASRAAVQVTEDRHPAVYYFPRADVAMDRLEPSSTTTTCPFKGIASYFSVRVGDRTLPDAAWTYETPFDEHLGLKGLVAFYTARFPELVVVRASDSLS